MHSVIIAPLPTPRGQATLLAGAKMDNTSDYLLTATVQNEIISNNSVIALYMLYRGIWWSSYRGINLKLQVNKRFWVLMILLCLYRGIWWLSYRGIELKEVNKWFWVLMILLGLYRGIRWSSYRGMEEANKLFWVLSDDTVIDHHEIVTSGICSFKQRGLFSANSLIY